MQHTVSAIAIYDIFTSNWSALNIVRAEMNEFSDIELQIPQRYSTVQS